MKKRSQAKYNYDVMIFLLVFLSIVISLAIFLSWSLFFLFLAIFLPISLLIYLLYTLFPFGKVQYWQGNTKLLKNRLSDDWEKLWLYQQKLDEILKEMQLRTLESGQLLRDEKEKTYWQNSWEAFLEYLLGLNTLTLRYQDFYLLDYRRDRELHAWAFLLSYLAFLYQYEAILRLVAKAESSEELKEFFNASYYFKYWKLKAFDELRYSLTKWENLFRWRVGNLYFRFLWYKGFFVYPIFKKRGKGFIKSVYRLHQDIKKKLGRKKKMFFFNPFRFLRNYGLAFLYPIQKNVARGASFVRFTERDYLISKEQIDEAELKLEPGDIMVERRNWHLTNVGIPGFWPHSALYLGNFTKFLAYFKELEEEMGETIEHYLQLHHKDFYEKFKENEVSVIESIRPGVVLQNLFSSAHADYWGVMRPRLNKKEKFVALCRAVQHLGKSYDFNFNFLNDDTFLCSELIYKAYMPSDDFKGIHFQMEEIGKHLLMPPNSIVKKFALEYDSPDSELDFVLFFDTIEAEQRAVEKTAEDFRKSWQRSKWDIMQE